MGKLYLLLAKRVFFSLSLRLIYESYFQMALDSFLNLNGMVWITKGDYTNNVFMILYAFVSCVFPFFILMLLQCNFEKLETASFKEKFETLYENIKPKSRLALL